MKKAIAIICTILLFSCAAGSKEISIFFTPSAECENNIVRLINKSETTIDAAVYAINNEQIVKALKEASRRGVEIRILTDRLQASNRSSKVRELYDCGINIRGSFQI